MHTTVHTQLTNALYHVTAPHYFVLSQRMSVPCWSAHHLSGARKSAGLINTESIQRRFTATLPGCKHLTYIESLKLIHIDSVKKADLRPNLSLHTKLSSDWLT